MHKKYVYIKKKEKRNLLLSMPVKETLQGPLNGFSPEQNSGFPILFFYPHSRFFSFFFCHFFSLSLLSPGIIKNWRHRFITAASVLLSHQEFSNAQSWLTNADLQSFGLPTEQSSWEVLLFFFLLNSEPFLFDFFFLILWVFRCLSERGEDKYGTLLTVFLKHRFRLSE